MPSPVRGSSNRLAVASRHGATPHKNDADSGAALFITSPQWMAPRKLAMQAAYARNANMQIGRHSLSAIKTKPEKTKNGIRPP